MLSTRPRLVSPSARALRRSVRRRTYASVTDPSTTLPRVGAKLHGFTLHRTKHVPELHLSALHFHHDKTGADYLHVARQDQNNVFSIGFQTNPPDATGVPHILEHVTLCGSEKYPVRDPFFKMLPRSLQNYMNAFTSSDFTTYPFATTNPQDFRNLMSVYLDATLHPLLKQSDFVQEGWRIGPENPKVANDAAGKEDLIFKGVVYNEMKGQVSDATYLFYIRFMQQLIPALNNSGGDPQKMTDLTYEQLKNFHKEHYHPSNAKILTYGDQPVERHLEYIGGQLARFEKRAVDNEVKAPIKFDGPKEVIEQGPLDPLTPPDAQYKTSTTWEACDIRDVHESFALSIALTVLLDGYGSAFYRALVESGLGTDFSPNTGWDTHGTKHFLTVGLNGVKEQDVPKVKETVANTLREAAAKGFDAHKIDGLMHQLELRLKHKTANFGPGLIFKLKSPWFKGKDPFEVLAWNELTDHFKAECAKGRYLEKLVEKYFLNDNTLTFTMVPNKDYGAEVAREESERLAKKVDEAIKQFPSEQEAHKQLRERELELIKEQDAGSTENVDSLPTLHVSDIPRQQPKIEIRDSTIANQTKVHWRETSTNGLTYFTALSLFQKLPDELRMLVPLFCDSLMRIGTKDKSMEELEDLIKLKTGGVSFGYHSSVSPSDLHKVEEGVSLGGWALDRNVPAMYELLQTILLETDFDSPKASKMIKQLLTTDAAGAVDGIARSGHSYAMRYATAGLSAYGRMAEQTRGLLQVKLISQLASAEENPEAVSALIQKLKAIQALAVSNLAGGRSRAAFICESGAAGPNESAFQEFITTASSANLSAPSIPSSSLLDPNDLALPSRTKTFFPLPYQVSYTGLALPTTPYTDLPGASNAILAQLLTYKHMHPEIREKGGAYGGGAANNAVAGTFSMYSYRDPNPANTLSVYKNALRWAAEREWSERELEEAKLSVFQSADRPRSVNSEGMERFLQGIEPEMEQRRREALLDVGGGDVKQAAEKLAKVMEDQASVALLGVDRGVVEKDGDWVVRDLGMRKVEVADGELIGEEENERARNPIEPAVIPEAPHRIQFRDADTGAAQGPVVSVTLANLSPKNLSLLLNTLLGHDEPNERLPYRFYDPLGDGTGEFSQDKIIKAYLDGVTNNEQVFDIPCRAEAVFKVKAVTRCSASISGHGESILAVAFSPASSSRLATGSGDKTARIWDCDTGTPKYTLKGHTGWVLVVSWSPDDGMLATGSMDNTARLWDPARGTPLGGPLKGHTKWVNSISWEPYHLREPGRPRFATASKDFTIRIWDAISRTTDMTLTGHKGNVSCVKWGGQGMIYSASHDRTVKIWNAHNGSLVHTLTSHAHWVNHLALSTDFVLRTAYFDHKGRKDIPDTVDAKRRKAQARYDAAIAPAHGVERLITASDDCTMYLWEPSQTTKPLARLTGHQKQVNHVTFSPDGALIASAGFDNHTKLWNAKDGKFLHTLRGHVGPVYQCAFSPDSRLLVSSSKDTTLKAWDVVTGKLKQDLPGHQDEVFAVDWAPDGERVGSGGQDRAVRVWRN
ncbi:putative Mitochondrial presequence protease [Teratosphaeria destructans]|uniref:Presequence protease, mitochondrial n=1 Tax=Teratosphaeria destructans TaxID=418781 RepID=A0A9W7SZC0_9PEZI|nr:putative Mitochondrial presequence protease [Teratosphaeria destructans]